MQTRLLWFSVVYLTDVNRYVSLLKTASPLQRFLAAMSYTGNYYGYQSGGYNTGASDDSGNNAGNPQEVPFIFTQVGKQT
jgi:hypothetical protein